MWVWKILLFCRTSLCSASGCEQIICCSFNVCELELRPTPDHYCPDSVTFVQWEEEKLAAIFVLVNVVAFSCAVFVYSLTELLTAVCTDCPTRSFIRIIDDAGTGPS